MRRRQVLAASVGLTTPSLAGCSLIPARRSDYHIGMRANAFVPESFAVSVGKSVIWYNNGSRAHTVTAYEQGSPDGASFFASGGYESESAARDAWYAGEGGAIAPGEAFRYTFSRPGRYEYFCVPHESRGMAGVIVVED